MKTTLLIIVLVSGLCTKALAAQPQMPSTISAAEAQQLTTDYDRYEDWYNQQKAQAAEDAIKASQEHQNDTTNLPYNSNVGDSGDQPTVAKQEVVVEQPTHTDDVVLVSP